MCAAAYSDNFPAAAANAQYCDVGLTEPSCENAPSSPSSSSDGNQTMPETSPTNGYHQPHQNQNDSDVMMRRVWSVPGSPVGARVLYMSAVCAFSGLLAGALLVSVGVVITGLVSLHTSGRTVPALWWCGIAPFLLSMLGVHMLVKRNRHRLYMWGLAMMTLALTQTLIMGWMGNFSTSCYDAWPPQLVPDVCKRVLHEPCCFCKDGYHGAYSNLQLAGVKYIIEIDRNYTKWRETMFQDCATVQLVSSLYFTCMASWGVYVVSAIVACIAAHLGSVCVNDDDREFEQLYEAAESHFVLTPEQLDSESHFVLTQVDSTVDAANNINGQLTETPSVENTTLS